MVLGGSAARKPCAFAGNVLAGGAGGYLIEAARLERGRNGVGTWFTVRFGKGKCRFRGRCGTSMRML